MRAFFRNSNNFPALALLIFMVAAAVVFAPKARKKLNFENRNISTSEKSGRFAFADSFVELNPFSSVTVDQLEHLLTFKSLMGKLEVNIPAGHWVRFQTGGKYIDITSMDGGRIKAESFMDEFQLRNVSGDLLMKQGSGKLTRVMKSSFVQISNGQVEISRLRMPEVLSPRVRERLFSLQAETEVALLFKTAQFALAKTEYVIFDAVRAVIVRGVIDGSIVKVNLRPGTYKITSRSRLGNEYSAWTVPREFSVWSKTSSEIATAF